MLNLILILCALVNLPGMLISKNYWWSYLAFGFCIGLFVASLIERKYNGN